MRGKHLKKDMLTGVHPKTNPHVCGGGDGVCVERVLRTRVARDPCDATASKRRRLWKRVGTMYFELTLILLRIRKNTFFRTRRSTKKKLPKNIKHLIL